MGLVVFCSPGLRTDGSEGQWAYALAGVIDLSVEVPISPRLSLASEFLYSPWESVKLGGHSRPEKFGYVLGSSVGTSRKRIGIIIAVGGFPETSEHW